VAELLLLEDDRSIREVVASALESEGHVVHEAGAAAEAALLVGTHPVGLAIVDLGLPDRDGVDFIRDLRVWSPMPVLVLSARNQEKQKVVALDSGADDYLAKPFGVAELLARVRALLRRQEARREAAEPVIRFADVVIDCMRRTVQKNGQPLALTQTEYRLLTCLATNAERVLTHQQLLLQVWGEGATDAQYLRVYVGHLRKKIETDPARPRHILTETGVGYRFRA
jgi:two-component system, OmpR family, KDP operon response regulator KdpE